MPRLLDLFCGRWGWSRAFAKRGWECVGVDLTEPPEIPENCTFRLGNVLNVDAGLLAELAPDFICASPPCQEFAKHRLKCFWPDQPYPKLGIKLFNHTRELCWESGIPYVIENVLGAEWFVGRAQHHCGPFYLWGNAVPAIMPQGIQKGLQLGHGGYTAEVQREWRRKLSNPARDAWSGSKKRADATAEIATIPPELANCVADYAERILEQREQKVANAAQPSLS